MALFEVSKGYIPEVRYLDSRDESVMGWLKVGPRTEKKSLTTK